MDEREREREREKERKREKKMVPKYTNRRKKKVEKCKF